MNPTLEERVAKLEREIESLKAGGSDSGPRPPFADVKGIGADDPLFDEWVKAIAERRREIDADPSTP